MTPVGVRQRMSSGSSLLRAISQYHDIIEQEVENNVLNLKKNERKKGHKKGPVHTGVSASQRLTAIGNHVPLDARRKSNRK